MGSETVKLRNWIAKKILRLKPHESIVIHVGGVEGKRLREEAALKFLSLGKSHE